MAPHGADRQFKTLHHNMFAAQNMVLAGVSDGLALDLQFATDKTLTARKGPTLTFTRASSATYYGPLVDYANIAFSTTAISNGRASWFKSEAGEDITISYNGTRWRVHTISGEFESEFFAAVGSEWRPDQANWSASGAPAPVITSSTFGIITAAINEPRLEYDPVTFECLGLMAEETSTNYVFPSTTLSTQTRTTTAVAHTLSFYGTGTVTLSGTHAATVVGTSSTVRRTYTFTPTAGSLTLTVTGTVSFAQLERQGVASSYIQTTTAIGTRASDNFNYASISAFYNELAGTIVCESTLKRVSQSLTPDTAIFGESQNGISMRDTTTLTGSISNDEDSYFSSVMGSVPLGVFRKSAMAFQNAGSAILCQNGTLGTQDDSILLPLEANNGVTPTALNLFMGQNSIIKSFRYYKKRLPNTKLQSLTSLVYNANDYITALTAAGATVTAPQRTAISTFISGEIAAGRWDKVKRLYFPVWQVAAANAICMKSLTSGTFSGVINHAAKGVRVVDGASGNMNTNTNLGALGITNTSFHFAMLLPEGAEEGYSIPFSVNDFSTNSIFPFWNDGYSYTRVMEQIFGSSFFTNLPSVISLGNDSVANNLYLKERISSSTGSDVIAGSVATTFPSANLFILGLPNGSVGMNLPIGAFSASTELSSAQDAAYTTALKTLWETVTGLTLP